MDLSNLKSNAPMLINHLKQNNYSISMVQYTEKVLRFLLEENNENWNSYEDARVDLLRKYKDVAKPTLSNLNSRLNMIIAYDLLGKLPDGNPVPEVIKKGTYYIASTAWERSQQLPPFAFMVPTAPFLVLL